MGFHSLADPGDGWVYIWGQIGTSGYIVIQRVDRNAAKAGDLTARQYWYGPGLGWRYPNPRKQIPVTNVLTLPGFVLSQATVHQRAGDSKWQLTTTGDSAHLQYALLASGGPDGIFPACSNICPLPTVGDGVLWYMAQAHPEQSWSGKGTNDTVVTCSPGFGNSTKNPNVYWPKVFQCTGLT
jgi:hypothetical protein